MILISFINGRRVPYDERRDRYNPNHTILHSEDNIHWAMADKEVMALYDTERTLSKQTMQP